MDVCGLRESVGKVGAYALRGRIGVGHIGVFAFELLQLFHEHVEIPVGDFGSVEHVVVIIVAVELVAQIEDALSGVGHSGGVIMMGILESGGVTPR